MIDHMVSFPPRSQKRMTDDLFQSSSLSSASLSLILSHDADAPYCIVERVLNWYPCEDTAHKIIKDSLPIFQRDEQSTVKFTNTPGVCQASTKTRAKGRLGFVFSSQTRPKRTWTIPGPRFIQVLNNSSLPNGVRR